MDRPSKDQYWMNIAREVGTRATCTRRKVGAVLVSGSKRIVSTGYNGAPEGLPHCLDIGCDMEGGHCVRTIHAEANVLIQAGHDGSSTLGATLYTAASPCRNCMGLIINAGIKRVVYADPYVDPSHDGDKSRWALDVAGQVGIIMLHLPEDKAK